MTESAPDRLLLDRLATPIGIALLVTDEAGRLRALDWSDYEDRLHRLLRLHYGAVRLVEAKASKDLCRALDGYFAGEMTQIDGIACATGGTMFQRQVWAALRKIRPARP